MCAALLHCAARLCTCCLPPLATQQRWRARNGARMAAASCFEQPAPSSLLVQTRRVAQMSLRAFFGKEKNTGNEPQQLHWKPDSSSQVCTDAKCGKEFNPFSRRKHHCRMCGNLFCQDCLFLERRLNIKAKPDYNGVPSRVCRSCFCDPSKPDEVGNMLLRTEEFLKKRVPQLELKDERIKMVRIVMNLPLNEKFVPWESDDKVKTCTPCGRSFKGVSDGKHHCRLCGKIFCDVCSRYRVALPPIPDVHKYMAADASADNGGKPASADSGGKHASADKGGKHASADSGAKQLRACEVCFKNCNRCVHNFP